MAAYTVDILAVGFLVLEWTVYAVTLEHSTYGLDSLSARMHVYREKWIRRLLDREARMVDTQIMASLQNGTALCCARPVRRWRYWAHCRSISAPRRRCGKSNASG